MFEGWIINSLTSTPFSVSILLQDAYHVKSYLSDALSLITNISTKIKPIEFMAH